MKSLPNVEVWQACNVQAALCETGFSGRQPRSTYEAMSANVTIMTGILRCSHNAMDRFRNPSSNGPRFTSIPTITEPLQGVRPTHRKSPPRIKSGHQIFSPEGAEGYGKTNCTWCKKGMCMSVRMRATSSSSFVSKYCPLIWCTSLGRFGRRIFKSG